MQIKLIRFKYRNWIHNLSYHKGYCYCCSHLFCTLVCVQISLVSKNWDVSVRNTEDSHDPGHHWVPVSRGSSKHLMLTASSTFHAIASNLFFSSFLGKINPSLSETRGLPGNLSESKSERGLGAEVRDQQLLPLRTLHWCWAKENTHTITPHTNTYYSLYMRSKHWLKACWRPQ